MKLNKQNFLPFVVLVFCRKMRPVCSTTWATRMSQIFLAVWPHGLSKWTLRFRLIDKQVSFLIEKNLEFVFCDYLKKKQKKTKKIICKKNTLTYQDLLYSCDVGLLTVLIKKNIIQKNLFPQIKTKEDFVTWLKIAKQGIYPTKVNEILAVWNDVDGSLSSNVFSED